MHSLTSRKVLSTQKQFGDKLHKGLWGALLVGVEFCESPVHTCSPVPVRNLLLNKAVEMYIQEHSSLGY